jgi:hypothetical protein
MPHTKEVARRKRRIKAVPLLGAAGLSLSLASGTSAAIGDTNSTTAASIAQYVLGEEQISDISLATFQVPDDESVGPPWSGIRPTMISQGACGADLYLPQNPPTVSRPVYQTPPPPRPRSTRPASKYKRS